MVHIFSANLVKLTTRTLKTAVKQGWREQDIAGSADNARNSFSTTQFSIVMWSLRVSSFLTHQALSSYPIRGRELRPQAGHWEAGPPAASTLRALAAIHDSMLSLRAGCNPRQKASPPRAGDDPVLSLSFRLLMSHSSWWPASSTCARVRGHGRRWRLAALRSPGTWQPSYAHVCPAPAGELRACGGAHRGPHCARGPWAVAGELARAASVCDRRAERKGR